MSWTMSKVLECSELFVSGVKKNEWCLEEHLEELHGRLAGWLAGEIAGMCDRKQPLGRASRLSWSGDDVRVLAT